MSSGAITFAASARSEELSIQKTLSSASTMLSPPERNGERLDVALVCQSEPRRPSVSAVAYTALSFSLPTPCISRSPVPTISTGSPAGSLSPSVHVHSHAHRLIFATSATDIRSISTPHRLHSSTVLRLTRLVAISALASVNAAGKLRHTMPRFRFRSLPTPRSSREFDRFASAQVGM